MATDDRIAILQPSSSRLSMYRNYGLDLTRIIAAFMVMAGHLIFGGSVSTGRPYSDWAGKEEALPLLTNNSLWKLDSYLLGHYGTASAILGVSLFFLVSGWLMPPMLEKYGRKDFLLNRIFRIFPMLISAVILATAIQYLGGDKTTLDKQGIITTATLTSSLLGKPLTLGVVWTLIIEFEFYLILAAIGKLSQRKILITTTGFLLITTIYALRDIKSNPLIPDLYFIIYMFVGSSARLAWEAFKSSESKLSFLPPIIGLVSFELNRYVMTQILKLHPGQDINVVSLVATAFLLIGFSVIGKAVSKNIIAKRIVELASDLTYSIYLTHLALGIFLISRLRHYSPNDESTIGFTFAIIIILSAITFKFIESPWITAFRKIRSRDR